MKNLVFKSVCVVFAASSALSMSSCQRVTTTNIPDDAAIGFTSNIQAPGSTDASVASKAEASRTNFVHGDQMGLWVVPFSTTGTEGAGDVWTDLRPIGNYADNVLHNFTGSFTPSASIFYPNAVSKVDLYAVSPYDATMSAKVDNSMTDPKAFSFAVAQNQNSDPTNGTAVVKSDIMTAFYRGAKQGSNGTLSFHHRLSRVLINFPLGSTYKGQAITGVKSVSLSNVPLKSLINITNTTDAPTIDPNNNPKVDITTYAAVKPAGAMVTGNYIYEAIATPGTTYAFGDVIVRVVLEVANIGDVAFMCKTVSPLVFEAKKQTNINVSINDQSTIGFATVSIQGWGTPIDVGAATTKHSNMLINCFVGSNAIIKTATTAKLTIEGEKFDAIVSYEETYSRYRLQYDHKSNFGGYLTAIEMRDANGVPIFTTVALPEGGLQIKGDPTVDNYSTPIGKMTFNSGGEVVLEKI